MGRVPRAMVQHACRPSMPRRVLVVSFALVAAAGGQSWPACQEQGRVFRHAGAYGLFTDLTKIGAKEGCWLSDCTKTDKFVCPSSADCSVACSRVDGCRFWTYEPGIRKCFLRTSDAGKEDHPDFVSGPRSCQAAADPSATSGAPATKLRVGLPFAKAALWAADLPALRPCDQGIGGPGCDNPYAAMGVWRYAVNNLRLAVGSLPESEKAQHTSTLQYIRQISADIAGFYRQPTAETFQMAVTNSQAVFSALRGWLQGAPSVEVEVTSDQKGAPHLPSGHSAQVAEVGANAATARLQLADGKEMPSIGFGTWQLNGQQAYDATIAALQAGYRHIDTAQAYMNEKEVGLGIRDSGVPREQIFIATKISDPAEFGVLEQRLEQQLTDLGTDYLDLYMLHSPGDRHQREAAWRTMEALHARGKVRSLGVSNFGRAELEELLAFASVKPVYLQNKLSIYNPGEQQVGSSSILPYAREKGIAVMGYSVINPWPFMLPPMEDPHVLAIAGRYGKSAAQILHRWALQLGTAVIPKSASPKRIVENAQLLDFQISEVDMVLLNGIVALSESTTEAFAPAWADDVYGLKTSSI